MKKINYQMPNKKKKIIIGGKEKEYTTLRKVLISVIIIALSSTVLVTATSALFSGEKEVGTHVVTGNLKFEFNRTRLVGEALNEKDYLEEFKSVQEVDLTSNGADAFSIDKMVPGATYTATFNLKNTGTTAFDANISFTNLKGENENLLKQINITTSYNGTSTNYTLDQYQDVKLDLGVLEVNSDANFDITIELPESTNNDAQDSEVKFDLKLSATQVVKK